ncbi:MAG: molybdopterin-dependent oxidoreductase [Desulfatiglandales bacterium]
MSILRDIGTPVFKAEGVPQIDIATYTLKVTGLVKSDRESSLNEIMKMSKSCLSSRLTSVSGWSVRADWEGIKWKDFLTELTLKPEATHVTFTSYGGIYATTLSLSDLDAPRVMVVTGVGGDPLEPEYGGPLRMIIPNLYGYKSCKWLVQMEFINHMEGGYWEDRGYSRSGIIEPGKTFDVNTRTYKEITGGEVLDF